MEQDKEYLEKDLPEFLVHSIEQMKKTWKQYEETGKLPIHWDLDFGELNSGINVAEVEDMISSEQAWYLREKYLKMSREDNT